MHFYFSAELDPPAPFSFLTSINEKGGRYLASRDIIVVKGEEVVILGKTDRRVFVWTLPYFADLSFLNPSILGGDM